jgi:hypothetical protein
MYLNPNQIVLVEPVGPESKVAQLISESKAKGQYVRLVFPKTSGFESRPSRGHASGCNRAFVRNGSEKSVMSPGCFPATGISRAASGLPQRTASAATSA